LGYNPGALDDGWQDQFSVSTGDEIEAMVKRNTTGTGTVT
jgi:hypothetical protein